MKFLFRSALRGIARSPLQTLILILTVVLSAMLFTLITETSFSVVEESALSNQADYGNANITITADGDGDSAYIGSADVGAALGEGDLFAGYMVLPAYDDGGTVLGAVTDFTTVGNIFDFSFTEYGTVTTQNINSVIFVSSDFAAERGLSVGDSCTVSVLGVSSQYIVQAINYHEFFGGYSFIINAAGALDVLSGISPVFTVFDSDDIPYSRVYVRTDGDVEQAITSINSVLGVSGWTAKQTGTAKEYVDTITTVLIPVIIMFTAVIAGVLVYFSLNIISRRRKRETANFILAGMPAAKVGLAFVLESLLYIAVGTAAGIVIAWAVIPALGAFEYASYSLTYRGVLVCIAAELAVEAVACLIYFLRGTRSKNSKLGRTYAAITASALMVLVSAVTSFFVGVSYLYILSIIGFIAVIALLFAIAAPICRTTSKIIAPRAESSGSSGGVCLSLALKNTANTGEMHNIMRILSVLLSVVIVAIASICYTNSLVETYVNFLNCDYIVLNADEAAAEIVGATDGTQSCSVCGIYKGQFDNGESFYIADIQDAGYINGNVYYAEGDGVYLSKASADLFGISVGDTFTVTIAGVDCALTLSGYTDGGLIGYFDADYFGFNKNVVLVRSSGTAAYLQTLSQSVAVYGAFVQTPDSLFSSQIESMQNIVKILTVYMTFMCVIAAIGAVNLVGVSYAARKRQFRSLVMVGMTRADVAKMVAFEALILLLYTVVISAISGALLCFFLNNGLRSYGFSFFT